MATEEEHHWNILDFGRGDLGLNATESGTLSKCGRQVQEAAGAFGDVFKVLRMKFGFQVAIEENAREAAVLLVASHMASRKASCDKAVELLRRDLRWNYQKWCAHHKIVPVDLSKSKDRTWGGAQKGATTEVALYHMIWCEASNLRFCPEFLCFVFDDLCRRLPDKRALRNVAPFLNAVIKPAYDLVKKLADLPGDHPDRPNFDDFNEFFHDRHRVQRTRALLRSGVSYTEALTNSIQKTFYETRSYMHLIRSCFRVVCFHALALHLSIIIAGCSLKDAKKCGTEKYADVGLTLAGMLTFRELIEIVVLGKPFSQPEASVWTRWLSKLARFFRRLVFVSLFPGLCLIKWTPGGLGVLSATLQKSSSKAEKTQFLAVSFTLLGLTVLSEAFRVLFARFKTLRNFLFGDLVKHPVLGEFFGGEWQTYYSATSVVTPPLAERLGVMAMWLVALFLKTYVSYQLSISPLVELSRLLRDSRVLGGEGGDDDAFRWHLINWEFRQVTFQALGFTDAEHLTLVVSAWLPATIFFFLDTEVYYILISNLVSAGIGVTRGVSAYLQPSEVLGAIKRMPAALAIEDVGAKPRSLRDSTKMALRNDNSWAEPELLQRRFSSSRMADQDGHLAWQQSSFGQPIYPEDSEEDTNDESKEDPHDDEEEDIEAMMPRLYVSPSGTLSENDEALRRHLWFAACMNEMSRTMRERDLISDEELKSMLYTIDEETLQDAPSLSVRDLTYPEIYVAINTPDAGVSGGLVKSAEVWRRLAFFVNTLRNIVHAGGLPAVASAKHCSTLVPYYNETVTPSLKELENETSEGVSALDLLRTISPLEFDNMVQRCSQHQHHDDLEAAAAGERTTQRPASVEVDGDNVRAIEIERFAAFRMQTLSRTANGLAYYDRALKLMAKLADDLKPGEPIDAFKAKKLLDGPLLRGGKGGGTQDSSEELAKFAQLKYTLVLSCQIFGDMRAAKAGTPKRAQADQIEGLMREFPCIRVAFVDTSRSETTGEKIFASVLVKWDVYSERIVEVSRVVLPGPFMIGEAKPSNQNHAIIFTRGEAVQACDMNQDAYFEEALKIPFFLKENFGDLAKEGPRIAGHREHVFTSDVSSLASFMSLQESLFVTATQRILDVMHSRMHYGHPDYFQRTAAMTCGGIAKASKAINLSEDIFGGFNFIQRGGRSTQSDLIQVGKGKDVGFAQISTFIGKISMGNAEQVLSRDVFRLNTQTDIFRHFSIFYSSIGHFFSQVGIIAVIFGGVYAKLFVTVRGIQAAVENANKDDNDAEKVADLMNSTLYGSQLLGLYVLVLLASYVGLAVEKGVFKTLTEFFSKMLLRGGIVFFAFSVATKSFAVHSTIVYGKATYQGTGRGFDIQHSNFVDAFRRYWRSHFELGTEIALALWVYYAGSGFKHPIAFFRNELIPWFFVVALLWTPFMFNPHGFDYLRVAKDFTQWYDWMGARPSVGRYSSLSEKERDVVLSSQSWTHWWRQAEKNCAGRPLSTKFFLIVIPRLRRLLLFWGLCQLGATATKKSIFRFGPTIAILISLLLAVSLLIGVHVAFGIKADDGEEWLDAPKRRVRRFLLGGALAITLALCLLFKVITLRALISLIFAVFVIAYVFVDVILVVGNDAAQLVIVRKVIQVAHFLSGIAIFVPILIISFLPWFAELQSRLLWNIDFSTRLDIAKVFARQQKAKSSSPHAL